MTAPSPPPARRRRVGQILSPFAALAVVVATLAVTHGATYAWHKIQRDPHRDGHSRVLFVGDSQMLGASDQMARTVRQAGGESRFIGAYSTGLLSGQGWWGREITTAVDDWHPDVVVIEACCNYGAGEPLFVMPSGATATSESEDMYTWWTTYARDAVRRAKADGAKVYWVTTPAADPKLWPLYLARIPRFNKIVDSLGVPRIDWAKVLTPTGRFAHAATIDGKRVAIRRSDGLHFTDAGNQLIVRVTFDAIKGDLGLV